MSENNSENQLSTTSPNGVHSEDDVAKSKVNHLKDSVGTNKNPSSNGNDSPTSNDAETTLTEKEELPDGVRRGVCKWFNSKKGFGFVTPDDCGKDVFVHQRVIKKDGFRSLRENEHVEFTCHESDKGLEATMVTGPGGQYCKGSKKAYPAKKLRCYNCGDFANHIAAKCTLGPMPKRCHSCKATDHLIADCPKAQSKETNNKFTKNPRKKTERQKSEEVKIRFQQNSKSEDFNSVEKEQEEMSTVLPRLNGDEINDKKELDN